MAWESKRRLRENLELTTRVKDCLIDEKAEAERKLAALEDLLDDWDYEFFIEPAERGGRVIWRPGPKALALRAERLAEERRTALAAIIDALGIKGYAPSRLYDLFADTEGGEKLTAEQEALQNAHLDRFWSDIQTTLRVREERKRAEADAKTEERISGLAKPAEKPLEKRAFGPISFGDAATATLNSTVPVVPNFTLDTESLAVAMAKATAAASKKSSGKKGKQ